MAEPTVRLSINIPPHIDQALRRACTEQGVTMTTLVSQAIWRTTGTSEHVTAVIDAALEWVRAEGRPDGNALEFKALRDAAATLAVIDDEARWGDDT